MWSTPTETSGLRFKDENAYAQGAARRPRIAPSVKDQHRSDAVVPAPLCEPTESRALNFWVQNWTDKPSEIPDIGREYLAYIPGYCKSSRADSTLRLALSALSLTVFGRVHGAGTAIVQANKYYARTATFKPSNLPTDSIVEFAGNRAGARFWKDVCHYLGTAGLLKSGSNQEQQCSQNLDLYRAVRRPIVRAAILRGMNVQGWLKDAAAFGEQGPALMLDTLMVRVAGLRAKALQIQHVAGTISSTLILSLEEILNAGQHLDLELSLWPHKITGDYEFSSSSFDPSDRDKLPWCTSIAHNYRSYSHAAAWNRYRAARMIIHSLLVGTITQLAGQTTLGSAILGQLQMSLVAIASLSTEMCCSIPYFFNYNVPSSENIIPKVVTHLAWPLTVAIGIKTIPEVEKYWFRRTLRSVAVALGDSVLECVSQGDEFEF
ncbi:hypothetical protein SUNI508_02625 [Seiridium unicorne]|uniref:Uncharacterized protein n=1 Tax=Seiridium unicorne TaxID=138068 RepID=A0ABR2UGE1_9PEZI